jgi:hypothetical protein
MIQDLHPHKKRGSEVFELTMALSDNGQAVSMFAEERLDTLISQFESMLSQLHQVRSGKSDFAFLTAGKTIIGGTLASEPLFVPEF